MAAQVNDNFGDGNFTNNPSWQGDDSLFIINTNNELQSNGPSASSAIYLATANSIIDSVEWNFLVKLGFNPSSTNYVRIYLMSNKSNLKDTLSGYFVQLGEAGSNPDSITVFKQSGLVITKIFTGTTPCASSSSAENIRLKITRSNNGLWKVLSDCAGGNNFISEGQFVDNSFTTSTYFGFYCRYATASRFDKYFFDDVFIGNIVADTIKPSIQSINIISSTEIDVKFSEIVEIITAENENNYSIDNGIGNPSIAQRDAVDFSLVHLQFANALQNGISYLISLENIKDENNNIIDNASLPLLFYAAQNGDVVINEIFADPTPTINLPNGEYVELKNNKNFPVNISGWTFEDATTVVTIPNLIIPADSFVVLCTNAVLDSFTALGYTNIIIKGLSSFPSLNNSGDSLMLKDSIGNIIDFVNFKASWYADATKDDGGWSLERIDATSNCGEAQNWLASNNANGGTPGFQNSVAGTFIDATSPEITNYEILSLDSVKIFFSESVNINEVINASNYTLNNGIGSPQSIIASGTDAVLIFSTTLDSTLSYLLTAQNIFDCSGNEISNVPIEISFTQQALQYDIIITEIFADPEPTYGLPEKEFVEIYNTSNKTLSLKNWQLADAADTTVLPDKNILPQQYLILCSTDAIQSYAAYGNVLGVQSFPSLNNTEDFISIINANGKIVHRVNYTDDWYRDNIKKEGGFSLEMIDTEYPCSGANNWKASDTLIGGTPGLVNSVNAVNPDNSSFILINAWVRDSLNVVLVFNKPLNENELINNSQFVFQPPLNVNSINILSEEINIRLQSPLQLKTIYTVSVSGIKDCSGNLISDNTAQFGMPEKPDSGDVVINEILFNPASSGSDFIEFYNRSNKIIDLKNFIVAETDYSKQDSVIDFTSKANSSLLLLPEMYVCITSDASNIKAFYFSKNPKNIITKPDLPNFNDDEGVIVLLDTLLQIIDKVAYLKEWHHPMIDDENGVSLERINFNRSSQDENNWHSAASTVGYATPAYENSQFSSESIVDETIVLSPESFSPNNDGFNDFLNISYNLKQPGYTANIQIFDSEGRIIKTIVRNELLALRGIFKWDGDNDNGNKALIGVYIIYIELFNAEGEVKKYKKSCVVAGNISR